MPVLVWAVKLYVYRSPPVLDVGYQVVPLQHKACSGCRLSSCAFTAQGPVRVWAIKLYVYSSPPVLDVGYQDVPLQHKACSGVGCQVVCLQFDACS